LEEHGMKRTKKTPGMIILTIMTVSCLLMGCDETTVAATDEQRTQQVARSLKENQQTPTDIDFSLERYNLIKRAYWVNGQREKAEAVVCPIQKPMGYIILFTDNGAVVGRFIVDGKVSSLNSYLTPDSEYYEYSAGEYSCKNNWLADVDGSYGENDSGIFFFTPEGKYIEWTGTYLYSDIPFELSDPVMLIGG
jgi:hypothetical protein